MNLEKQLLETILNHLESGEELHLEINANGRRMILSMRESGEK